MKMLIGLFSVAMSFSAVASTVDTKTFVYDGLQNSVELILRAEKTHTEYRTEDQRTTCYRTVVVGHTRICNGGSYGPNYPRPYPGPGYSRGPGNPRGPGYPYPNPDPRQCYNEPVVRTVPYSCIQTVRIPFEVKDFDVDARVIIDVTKLSPEATSGETFTVTLNGDELSYSVVGSKKFFIVKKMQDARSTMNGSVKIIDGVLAAELIEAAPVLKAIKMTDISIENGVLNFGIGQVESRANLGFSLKVLKVKTFGSDTIILDRELLASEVELTATSTGSAAGVNVNNLGVELTNGKFSLTAKAFAKFNGKLMNGADYEELTVARTLIYKIR